MAVSVAPGSGLIPSGGPAPGESCCADAHQVPATGPGRHFPGFCTEPRRLPLTEEIVSDAAIADSISPLPTLLVDLRPRGACVDDMTAAQEPLRRNGFGGSLRRARCFGANRV